MQAQLGKKLLFSTTPPFCENAGLSNSSSGIVNEAASDLTTCLFKSCNKTPCFQSWNFAKPNVWEFVRIIKLVEH